MNKKTLSVSIAAYNAECYLDNVVDILNTSEYVRNALELIIVNDGSKDNTEDKANRLKKMWPTSVVVINKDNGGYGSTINSSIRVASGKYFKLLDADDWFEKENIEEFLNFLDETNEDLVISPYYKVFEEKNDQILVDRHTDDTHYKKPLYMHEICIKTELYRSAQFRISEHCFYTDTEFALECMLLSTKMKKFSKPIYCYRIGREGQSVSIESRIKNIKDSNTVAKRCLDMINDCDSSLTNYNVIQSAVLDMMSVQYQSLSFLDRKACKNELRKFDLYIKNTNSRIYNSARKKVKFLRMINFSSIKLIKCFLN